MSKRCQISNLALRTPSASPNQLHPLEHNHVLLEGGGVLMAGPVFRPPSPTYSITTITILFPGGLTVSWNSSRQVWQPLTPPCPPGHLPRSRKLGCSPPWAAEGAVGVSFQRLRKKKTELLLKNALKIKLKVYVFNSKFPTKEDKKRKKNIVLLLLPCLQACQSKFKLSLSCAAPPLPL